VTVNHPGLRPAGHAVRPLVCVALAYWRDVQARRITGFSGMPSSLERSVMPASVTTAVVAFPWLLSIVACSFMAIYALTVLVISSALVHQPESDTPGSVGERSFMVKNSYMTVRPNPGQPLPKLARVSRQMIIEEAEELRAALEGFSNDPQPGCLQELDREAWMGEPNPGEAGRAQLLEFIQHQAVLTYINAYDHLHTLGRALGSDGAMTLFAHSSLSRIACEAAARFAWLLDPGVIPEERIMRGAVALLISAEERLKGANRIPSWQFDTRSRDILIGNCTAERDSAHSLIISAGIRLVRGKDAKRIARLQLDVPKVSVPLKLDVTELMDSLLSDSPGWYNAGSSVTHSYYWGLRDAIGSRPGDQPALGPDLLNVGAAVESAISASGLILARCAGYYGHDPEPHLRRSRARREEIDVLMQREGIGRLTRQRII
jgi:hypothetical protein